MHMTSFNLLQKASDTVSFSQGEVIFQEGEPGDVMYAIVEGDVDILVHGKVIETIHSGGIVGEMALIDHQARSATAVARTDGKLVAVDEKRFQFLVQQTPYFALQVMRILVGRLRHMNDLE
jgi:CRP/FNR family transcriptional regulator, cyclic AMP receptor protein